METLGPIGVIFDGEWRRNVRSARGVVLLALFVLFTAVALLVVGALTAKLDAQFHHLAMQGASPDQIRMATQQAHAGILGFLFSSDPAVLNGLTKLPLVVPIVFRITLLFLPLYIAVMGFDQISGEVGPRSIRYLLVRVPRSAILFGKFLGQAAVLVTLMVIVDLGIFVYARVTHPELSSTLGALILGRMLVAAVVYSLAYLGLTALCSTWVRNAAVSLVLNVLLLFGFWLIDVLWGGAGATGVGAWISHLSPSHYAVRLLYPAWSTFGVATGAYVLFAAIFLGASYLLLRTKDL